MRADIAAIVRDGRRPRVGGAWRRPATITVVRVHRAACARQDRERRDEANDGPRHEEQEGAPHAALATGAAASGTVHGNVLLVPRSHAALPLPKPERPQGPPQEFWKSHSVVPSESVS